MGALAFLLWDDLFVLSFFSRKGSFFSGRWEAEVLTRTGQSAVGLGGIRIMIEHETSWGRFTYLWIWLERRWIFCP